MRRHILKRLKNSRNPSFDSLCGVCLNFCLECKSERAFDVAETSEAKNCKWKTASSAESRDARNVELGFQYCRFEDPAEAAEIFEKGKEEEKKEEKEKGTFQELVSI